jgi:hypothetical protein
LYANSAYSEPIFVYGQYGSGRVLTLCGPIKNDFNEHSAEWPYFNYLMYFTAMYLAKIDDNSIDIYSKWPYSPLPSTSLKILVLCIILIITFITFMFYFLMKKKSKRTPLKIRPPTELEQLERKRIEGC